MSDLKTELLRFKDIVDGMIEQADTDFITSPESNDTAYYKYLHLVNDSEKGINAIIELAEELEKDNER